MSEHGPTARHRRLAAELRRLREEAGITSENAAGLLTWSRPKLVRIETAKAMPSVADVSRMLAIYGGSDARRGALLQLAREVRTRGWWAAYGDVLTGSYAELEDAASKIKTWQTEIVPGLLQTEAYARTLIEGEFPDDPAEVDRRLQARLTRRSRLARTDIKYVVLLAEEVLRRLVGGAEVMARQLDRLLDAGERPNTTISVVPISMTYRPALGQGALTLFHFNAPLELDTAFVETMAAACTSRTSRRSGSAPRNSIALPTWP
ncbi:helix-turn-helix domain-containing protein [Actinomadura sp. CNU-125]|uniref:helix-turn-helix domain-containing protein n=1 Tax=Actinomadura sp. CNU-125 TaxID=1904961 RepID=UPI0021CCA8FB|nr:helix-turn-helix transcriptional regulator [Actinomadura sp. CNU-125]